MRLLTEAVSAKSLHRLYQIDDGGCSAVPRYPETRADLERVKKACEDMNQDVEIEKAFENIRKLD